MAVSLFGGSVLGGSSSASFPGAETGGCGGTAGRATTVEAVVGVFCRLAATAGLTVFLGLPVGRRRRAWIFSSLAVRRLGFGFLALALALDLMRRRVAMDAFVQIKLETRQA